MMKYKKEKMNIEKLLQKLVNKGIVTDKKRLLAMLAKNNFELTKIHVTAIGYDGKSENVPIDANGLFECCLCDCYCVYEYGVCPKCENNSICANCARGDSNEGCREEREQY